MRLLLDEMHAPVIADTVRASGHDVRAVAAEPELRGCSDLGLLEHACANSQAIVTENVVDFSSLAASWASEVRHHSGLIFTSPRRFNRASLAYPGTLIDALEAFLKSPPIQGQSWQWWLTLVSAEPAAPLDVPRQ